MRLRAFPSFSFVPAAGVETQPEIDSGVETTSST